MIELDEDGYDITSGQTIKRRIYLPRNYICLLQYSNNITLTELFQKLKNGNLDRRSAKDMKKIKSYVHALADAFRKTLEPIQQSTARDAQKLEFKSDAWKALNVLTDYTDWFVDFEKSIHYTSADIEEIENEITEEHEKLLAHLSGNKVSRRIVGFALYSVGSQLKSILSKYEIEFEETEVSYTPISKGTNVKLINIEGARFADFDGKEGTIANISFHKPTQKKMYTVKFN